VTATNGNVGTAYATQLNGFTLTQTSGPSCTPKLTAGATPAMLGDLAPGASASASFTVSIVGCNPNSLFTLSVPWSSAVYDTGTFVTNLDFKRGK
jgi:endo-1,4-beta-xylanase